ncbi:hypothetical protein VF21_06898 [Pseudogymnoascus sp. 05NY08]|nr:hypothetical protein VF21_06898 [Pseudogymnoascus sp. 05NY08]
MLLQHRILRYALLAALAAPNLSHASSGLVSVDASSRTLTPQTGQLQMGSAAANVAPNGDTFAVNNQSLVSNGKPWVPVAGEFHYSRYPAEQWLPELLKMKAAGVDVISTYVIWIHHEEVENQFDFSGNRNITRFIETATEAGFQVIARLGPWVQAEVRNGGLPDWLFWTEIADRINGAIFKHGGSIFGVQLENEYKQNGSGQGAAHIATLKALAISLGLDVPLYTCTGWENTFYPPNEVVPVFGGYQDAPWDVIVEDEPPNETFSFRYVSRASGSDSDNGLGVKYAAYPFLTAEYGSGAASMYRRRVVMSLPDDITAIVPVQLGSGVNLFGWYMFHGGENPSGKTANLQESTVDPTKSYNDLPVLNYDYQSPLGQYGNQRSTLNRMKLFHYWLNKHGSQLAGMSMRKPEIVQNGTNDLSSLRWSVRSNGDSGYLFVNNYVRQHEMSAQTDIQFSAKFFSGTVTVPHAPVTIPSGAYFIWPLNLSLGGANLIYATAQLITSLDAFGRTIYVFVATNGVPVEFSFDRKSVSKVSSVSGRVTTDGAGRTLVSSIKPGIDIALHATDKHGKDISIVVLDQATADSLWHVTISCKETLILTEQALGPTSRGFELTSYGSPKFNFATFPAINSHSAHGSVSKIGVKGLFTHFTGRKSSKSLSVTTTPLRAPGIAPPVTIGGPARGAVVPSEDVINGTSGLWTINIPWSKLAGLDDAQLRIDYQGDLARLYAGSVLLDDHFYDGETWVIGLKRLAGRAGNSPLTLAIMPLRSDAPIYLQTKPTFDSNG